jgi:hypothetical protein
MKPGDDVFTEDDLAPSSEERRARFRDRIERGATAVAVAALGLWMGGLVALGTCAAPFVFERTPYPFSAQAMGAAFERFDRIAIGCAVVVLAAEVARTVAALRRPHVRSLWARVRRYGAIFLAGAASYSGLRLTPEILRLHQEGLASLEPGLRPGLEASRLPESELGVLHTQAELLGKGIVVVALALIVLHVMTLRGTRDDDDVDAPLPPGPRD